MNRTTLRIRRLLSHSERAQMWYLERDLAALKRDYRREMAGRRSGGDAGEIHSRYSSDEQLAFEELEGIRTERLVRRARTLRVPLPSSRPHGFDSEKGDENWWLGNIMGGWNLTDEGELRLRQAIREEGKARRESAAFWFGIVTTLVGVVAGLVGAITGLIVVWRS